MPVMITLKVMREEVGIANVLAMAFLKRPTPRRLRASDHAFANYLVPDLCNLGLGTRSVLRRSRFCVPMI
jgi:hypothetical protein